MKIQRLLVLTVVLVLGLSSVASGLTRCLRPPHSDAPSRCQVIAFEDAGMESAVREAIGKSSGSIVLGDVVTMESFSATHRNIQSLEGMEYLRDLKELTLNDNAIEDLRPLAGLTNLTRLGLGGNAIEDLRPLARLRNLEDLSLAHNKIVDISALEGLTNLTDLGIGDNEIEDISPLAGRRRSD